MQEMIDSWKSEAQMQRPGQPCEVAPAYVFLASEDGSYISGEIHTTHNLHIKSAILSHLGTANSVDSVFTVDGLPVHVVIPTGSISFQRIG